MENLETQILEENHGLSLDNQEPESKEEARKKKETKNGKGRKKKSNLKDKTLGDFDIRGTQTLFRTLSRNHYNLLRMVDNKSNIVLTMNSIIITLMLGSLYIADDSQKTVLHDVSNILINFSLLSMIFALISMLPHRYLGRAYHKSGYKGNLYAGNYAKYSLEEFEREFERIMDSGKNLYQEMIQDLYFLGKSVYIKQSLLRFSVGIFLFGLISSIIYYNFHILF